MVFFGEDMMEIYKPWMRCISFDKVISIFRLISGKNNGLSFIEIRKTGIENGIFKDNKGKSLSGSTIHCYLGSMKKLNLIDNVHGKYKISKNENAVKLFSSLNDKKIVKDILASVVVSNLDCRHYFF